MVVGFRDPAGVRPLALGQLGDRYCFASESCAFDIIGAEFLREVEPGEMISLGPSAASRRASWSSRERKAFCVFEHIYFARPDSILEGQPVAGVAPQDGRDPLARGAGRGRHRRRRAGLGQPGREGLLAGVGHPDATTA